MTQKTRPELLDRKEYKNELEYKKAKMAQLAWDIKMAEQRINQKTNKELNKKKILLGAFVLNQIENNQINKADFYLKLDKFLTRQADRILFTDELKQVPNSQN